MRDVTAGLWTSQRLSSPAEALPRAPRNGKLFYPDTRAFFDGIEGPHIPDSDVSPIWNPEFFGNVMVVNGRSWPRLVTERRRYRFRLLNGCDSRFLIILAFDDPRVKVWWIGTEGGFLPRPLNLNELTDRGILLGSPNGPT